MSFWLSRGEAEVESETGELCRAPNSRAGYSLSNLNQAGLRIFECVATRRNKKVWAKFLFNSQFLTNRVR